MPRSQYGGTLFKAVTAQKKLNGFPKFEEAFKTAVGVSVGFAC